MKQFLRWFILGATFFFLVKTFHQHWQDVLTIEFKFSHLIYSAIALLVTLIAHIWSGIVWAGMIKFLEQPAPLLWVLPVYLKTNLAKYIPGNVWHFYGRIRAMQTAGSNLEAATLITLLEPLLMATAAVLIALATIQEGWLMPEEKYWYQWLPPVFAAVVLILIHPFFLNKTLKLAAKIKNKTSPKKNLTIPTYPWLPLMGEIGFVLLRASGFLVTIAAFTVISWREIPLLLGTFSLSWFLGLVVPSPGGMGVFESSAIALLTPTLSPAIVLSSLALFRLLSLSAEALAAAIAWGMSYFVPQSNQTP